jgi:lysophospholipase L1-like esterase
MNKPEWFDDETHFNDTGAKLYSKFIADKIKMD